MSVHTFVAINSYLIVIRLDTHSMDTGYGLSDFTYPVSVPATEPAYEAYHYDNSSLNSSSPSSSAPHTPSIDVHLNTSFCQSLTAASSGDSLRQPAPTYLQVPIANPVTRTRSLQDRRGQSLHFVRQCIPHHTSRFPTEYVRPTICIAISDLRRSHAPTRPAVSGGAPAEPYA